MAEPKVFFTSYSHSNRDKYLERFVEDLAADVRPHLKAIELENVYFFDVKRLETGNYWREKLAHELTTSKTLVAICTPAFASSPFCGKELNVFLERVAYWKKLPQTKGPAVGSGPLFPIIWVAGAIPKIFSDDVQNAQGDFPEIYKTKGLLQMYKLRKYAEQRKEVVLILGELIAKAASEVDLPAVGQIPSFELIASAFEEGEQPNELGVALLPLVEAGLQGPTYPGGASLATLFQATSGAQVPTRLLEQTDLADSVRASRAAREAVLVVTDSATLSRPVYQPIFAALNAELGFGGAVIVQRAATLSAVEEEQLSLSVTSALGDAIARGAIVDFTTARTAVTLETKLSKVILDMRKAFMANQAPVPAKDDRIAAEASKDGIPIDTLATVAAPGSPVG